jgi:hypothetical protein
LLTLVVSCDRLAIKEIEKNTQTDQIEKRTYKLQPKSFKGLSFTPFESKNHEQNKELYLM